MTAAAFGYREAPSIHGPGHVNNLLLDYPEFSHFGAWTLLGIVATGLQSLQHMFDCREVQ